MIDMTDIIDPAAAKVFANPRQRKLVLALVDRERSLSDLAALTQTPLNLLHHHMRSFLRLGLVAITRRQVRAGAPIKFYRATARAFFVPAELAGGRPSDSMSVRLRAAVDRNLARTVKGVVYSHDGDGARMRVVRDKDCPATAFEVWLEVHLDEADAATLADELRTLLARFGRRPGASGRAWIVHAAIAPS